MYISQDEDEDDDYGGSEDDDYDKDGSDCCGYSGDADYITHTTVFFIYCLLWTVSG